MDALTPGALEALARELTGARSVALQPCGGGRNSRVYRVDADEARYALKFFPAQGARDRLQIEFGALEFMRSIGASVPKALRKDTHNACALYEWIDGEAPSTPSAADIDAVLFFMATIHRGRAQSTPWAFPLAAEATPSLADLESHLRSRAQRLAELAGSEPELAAFLRTFVPALEDALAQAQAAEDGFPATLPEALRTLSPSDFSVHNALRRRDGTLVFLDFEYFGWDDPVKLCSDFLWHPAMTLPLARRRHFLSGVADIYKDDPFFERRLAARAPLFGLKWCLIMLNEYRPERWQTRLFSGEAYDWASAKARQLEKARAFFAGVRQRPGALA